MSVLELKAELHQAIDGIEDESFLAAVLVVLTSGTHLNSEAKLTDEEYEILNQRESDYASGKTGAINLDEWKEKMNKRYGL